MNKNILIITPKRNLPTSGGVSSYWNAIIPELKKMKQYKIIDFEVGGHGKNPIGVIIDQLKFRKMIHRKVDLVILNPSMGSRSFFRDSLFAKQLTQKRIPFIVFFRGWNIDFVKKINKNYKNFFLNSFGKANLIIVLSQDFKTKIREWGYKEAIIVETTTVDRTLLRDFSSKDRFNGLKYSDKKIILFLSRILREKGVYELVAAFNNLKGKYHNIELIIAGVGRDYNNLEGMVKSNKSVTMTGYVNGSEKVKLFEKAHIYCLPSFSEGLPNSVLEAMAFGLPVITTKVGGLKSFFQNNRMGYFVEPKSISELVEKLEILLKDKDKIIEIGKYNYDYAHMKLLSNIVAERIYSYIIKVL